MSRMLAAPLAAGFLLACRGEAGAGTDRTVAALAAAEEEGVCRVDDPGRPLPAEVRETSGLARGRRDPGVFWTHNDAGNGPELFALGADGRLVGRVTVQGVAAQDWEDVETGPCEGGTCLYVGDIGDNEGERESIAVYQIPEPEGATGGAVRARELRARFPDGPRDAEALFALPSGDLFVVTKGRQGPIALYRYPAPLRPGQVVTLERVRELGPEPDDDRERVTSATATPDGRWVAIRSYRTLRLYPAAALVGGGAAEPIEVDLRPLGERQGEGVAIADDGTVWLSSEAERKGDSPTWARLRCTLPAP